MDVFQLKTKVQEMKKQIKILELQVELETKIKILKLKAELEVKHVILEAQIRKTQKVVTVHQRGGQSQSSSASRHAASPKSVTSTGRPESPGAKAVKDGKDNVFGKLLAKLSRSAPYTPSACRSSHSTSNSPDLLGWLTRNILKARGKNRSI